MYAWHLMPFLGFMAKLRERSSRWTVLSGEYCGKFAQMMPRACSPQVSVSRAPKKVVEALAAHLDLMRPRLPLLLAVHGKHATLIEARDDVVISARCRSDHLEFDDLAFEVDPCRLRPDDDVVVRRDEVEHLVQVWASKQFGREFLVLPRSSVEDAAIEV